MSSRSLADVEWRIIMQMCDSSSSILSLARCNSDTLRVASSNLSWSALSPVIFRSNRLHLAECISNSLLRFADIGIRWCGSSGYVSESEIVALASVPRLRMFDVSKCSISPNSLNSLLQHVPSLTALRTGYDHSIRDLACVIAAHAAATLRMSLRSLHLALPSNGQAGELIKQLVRAKGITDLGIDSAANMTQLQPLLTFVGLRQLSLSQLQGNVFHPLLTSSNMRGLVHLTLKHVAARHANGVESPAFKIEWTECFANLLSLQSITLEQCGGVNVILSAIDSHAIHSLSSLFLSFHADGLVDPMYTPRSSFPRRAGSPAPSIHRLHQLLSHRLDCRLKIQIESKASHVKARLGVIESGEVEWENAKSSFESLVVDFPSRVIFRCTGVPPLADTEMME